MRIDVWSGRGVRASAIALALAVTPAAAQKGVSPSVVVVGGAPMVSDQDIMENLSRSTEHRIFIALLHQAGLSDLLRQHGPFTVFAPNDAAFAGMPPGELDALRHPDNKATLVKLLKAHIVPGDYSSSRLRFLMRGGKGQAELEDLAEDKLTVSTNGPSNLILRDAKGTMVDIILYDVKQANGVVFVTDRVVAPG